MLVAPMPGATWLGELVVEACLAHETTSYTSCFCWFLLLLVRVRLVHLIHDGGPRCPRSCIHTRGARRPPRNALQRSRCPSCVPQYSALANGGRSTIGTLLAVDAIMADSERDQICSFGGHAGRPPSRRTSYLDRDGEVGRVRDHEHRRAGLGAPICCIATISRAILNAFALEHRGRLRAIRTFILDLLLGHAEIFAVCAASVWKM